MAAQLRLDVLDRGDARFGNGAAPGRPFLDHVRDLQPGGSFELPRPEAPGTRPPAATPATPLSEQGPPSLPRLPPLGAAGAVTAGAAALTAWDRQRAGQAVSGVMARFGLDPSKPADAAAAQAYAKASWIVPMNPAWDVPYAGPAHDRVAEAVMHAERDDPGLFDRAYSGSDPAAFDKLDGVVRDAMADVGGAAGKLPPGGAGNVREDGECDENSNLGPNTTSSRLPRNGTWQGEMGNSPFLPSDPAVKAITGGKPINFVNGRPDFTPWAKLSINFAPGLLTGVNDKDFRSVYEALANGPDPSIKTVKDAQRYMDRNGLTAHHATDTCMQLVPTTLNRLVPHIGAAADLRHQGRLGWTPPLP